MKILTGWVAAAALVAAVPRLAAAQRVHTSQPQSFELRETRVEMDIRDGAAVKRLRLLFHNPNAAPRSEADFFLDLDPDQRVSGFRVTLGGKEAEAELLDQEKARRLYEEIVRKQKDPALLELYGRRALRVRLFPVPPQSDFSVEIETTEALEAENGIVRVQTLNLSPASYPKPIGNVVLEATIASTRPIRSVFSPTHAVDVVHRDARAARISFERRNYVPAGPFVFYCSLDDRDLGATLLAHAEPGEDGAFMLTIDPPAELRQADPLPRDIVFVVDASGSMLEGRKIDQARAALCRFIEGLAERDRFNIVPFATEASRYRDEFVAAAPEIRAHARSFVETIRARGGTNIEEALRSALAHRFRPEAAKIVLFMSDGIPTIGERDPSKLTALAAGREVRLFAFGLGVDVHTQLLDRLAIETGGDRRYVLPQEDLAAVLDGFARKVGAPVLSGPELAFAGEGGVMEVHPRRLPDLFRGSELTVTGRFRGAGPRRVELTGLAGGKRFSRVYGLDFQPDARHEFVPRLWAIQKIDYLIDEVRRGGSSKEVLDHIVELARKYAVVTPYTSFLFTEDTPVAGAAHRLGAAVRDSAGERFTGPREFHRAANLQSWRGASNSETQMEAANGAMSRRADAQGIAQTLNEQRMVGSRAFVNGRGGWMETPFQVQNARSLRFGSDDYFRFARENPGACRMLALGRNVTFRNGSEWIRIES